MKLPEIEIARTLRNNGINLARDESRNASPSSLGFAGFRFTRRLRRIFLFHERDERTRKLNLSLSLSLSLSLFALVRREGGGDV
jgi:hypothetical protein